MRFRFTAFDGIFIFFFPRETKNIPDKKALHYFLVVYKENWGGVLKEMTGLILLQFLNNMLMSIGLFYTGKKIVERHHQLQTERGFTFPIEDTSYNNIRLVLIIDFILNCVKLSLF